MRIYRRGKGGIYWLQWKGKRQSLGVTDRTAAELAARDLQRRAADPTYEAARARTYAEAAREYLSDLPTAHNRTRPPAAGTLEMVGHHVGHLCRILGGDRDLATVATAAEVQRYTHTRRREQIPGKREDRPTVGAHTVAKELGTHRAILRFAVRRGWLPPGADACVPARLATGYRPLTRALTWDQVAVLLRALSPERAAQCAFVIGLGADKAAITRARLEDFGRGSVLVRGSKTPSRHARVPIVEPFVALVEQARRWLKSHAAFTPWRNSVRDLEAACTRAGLPRVTLRDLRRTHGQVLRARGVPPHLIGAMLRHTDGRMAERVYGTLEPEALGALVRGITGARPRSPRSRSSRGSKAPTQAPTGPR